MSNIFINHEAHPLVVTHAAPSIIAAYALILILAALLLRKRAGQAFMDEGQTGQLKGLAIILIVCGHLNRILAEGVRVPNFAGFGVAIFLFCSGYGLAASYMGREFTFRDFFYKRLTRVFIPYWLVVAVVMVADYTVLGLRYTNTDIACAAAGMDILRGSERLEYTRWFITYIIMMYGFFFISTRARTVSSRLAALFGCTVAMDILIYIVQPALDVYIQMGNFRHFMIYSMAFPAGCAAFAYRGRIESIIGRITGSGWSIAVAAVMVISIFALKTVFGDPLRALFNRGDMTSVSLEAVLWQPAFLVAITVLLALMAALRKAGYVSIFLAVTGSISYEIFLVHSALMVRYDFFLFREPFLPFFIVYLIVVFIVSWMLSRVVRGRLFAD